MVEAKRISQSRKALSELRALILDGTLEAGSRLAETALAERLGISRTPLREAMTRLVEEGLLERQASGGCRVCRFTMTEIVDAIELRGVMEGTAARLAAERGADPELLAQCHEILAGIDDALAPAPPPAQALRPRDSVGVDIDFDAYVALNARFHALLAQLAGSDIVAREVERSCRQPLASPSAFLAGQEQVDEFRRSLGGAQEQHKAILDAIENGEGARAEALAREHARLARHNLKYALTSDPGLVEQIPGLALVSAQ